MVGSGGVDPWRIRGGAEPREAPEARRQLGAAASAVAASTRAGAGEGARRVAAASVEAEPVRKWRRRGSAGMAALGSGGARGGGLDPEAGRRRRGEPWRRVEAGEQASAAEPAGSGVGPGWEPFPSWRRGCERERGVSEMGLGKKMRGCCVGAVFGCVGACVVLWVRPKRGERERERLGCIRV